MVDYFAPVVVRFRVPMLLQSFIQMSTIYVSGVELHVLESCLELSEALSTVHQHP